MPFKSEKQRKWMHANQPEMAKKWEKEEESVEEVKKRDYKTEYKKDGSSKKSKKYRAELNKYNRQKGTYGNGDKKDASHKGGKIVGFEEQSKNRGRAEKSRLKKEQKLTKEKLIEIIKDVIKEDFAGAYPEDQRKKFDNKRRKQSEVLGYKLTGKNDVKTETDDATVKEGFADNFMKTVDKHNQKIVDNALALSKQQAIKDKQKGSEQTPKLIAIKTINNMKELRNKTKSPALKKTFEKTIGKLEKDYKKIKEHMAGGLTYKKGKTVMVTHKTSGKELVIIDRPAVRKEYEKIGYFAEGKITEAKETGIDIAKRIVKNHQHEKGVDVQTANLILKIHQAYAKNPALQKKFEKLPLKKLAQGVWRFVK